jgi:hypothetical protein
VSLFAEQLHTIAQMDSDQWVNFVILLIMAILWLFGSLIKAASKKKSPQAQQGGLAREQRETWQQRLARKAEEIQRAAEGQRRQAEERIRHMEERATLRERAQEPPPGKVAVRSSRGGESVMVYEKAKPQADTSREQHAAGRKTSAAPIQSKLEPTGLDLKSAAGDLAGVTLRPTEPIEPGEVAIGARHDLVAGYDPASIIDYSDPDALKKAVLHYEILGKPVGMRDPSDQSTGF